MDFVKSVLDVLGGRVASDCAYAGVVVLLAKGVYPAEGEGDAMNAAEPLRSSTLVMHPLLDRYRRLATSILPLAVAPLLQRCTG